MSFKEFHFEHPFWLGLLFIVPCVWAIFYLFYQKRTHSRQLEKFIDKHLLPYLLLHSSTKQSKVVKGLFFWSVVWSMLVLAIAGPRWSFREIEVFTKDQSLVIILDLSESMNATDVTPSRLGRAKQKIEDVINLAKGVKLGLIAFAADPHMIVPITDDKETLRHLLPALDTDLIYVQGSRLSSALEMAAAMLKAESGENKAILVISDGGFEDAKAIELAKKLAEEGTVVHAMGVGTAEGIPLRDRSGNIIKKEGNAILSKLEEGKLKELSRAGNGYYLEAHYTDTGETMILDQLAQQSKAEIDLGKKKRLWDERFYLLILPTLPIILWWFRRGYLFALAFLLVLPTAQGQAYECFKNSETLAKDVFDQGNYDIAAESFQDCYRKGVAFYKGGHFAEAEDMFQASSREEVACQAAYNLGNALTFQNKLEEAIAAFEAVLDRWPDHLEAQENLDIVKKMLEQQDKQDKQGNKDQEQGQDKQQDKQQKKEQDKQDRQDRERQDKDKRQQDEQQRQEQDGQDKQDRERQDKGEGQQDKQQNLGKEMRDKKQPSQSDQDADLWLNCIENDPKSFLRNQCYIESKNNGTTKGSDPW